MAVAMGGWSAGQAIWSWHQISTGTLMPGPSLADVGYFTLPVFAFAALLVLATDGSRSQPGDAEALPRGRSPWVLALDGLIVVGALFNITWSTALGPVVHAGAPTPLAFAVTIGYPVTDLILVVMVILLLGTYRGSRPRRPQLVLIGLGLIGISTSDSIFAYLVSSGAPAMPPILDTGSMAGPVLIALAALAPVPGPARETRRYGWATEWPYLLAPYLTVLVGGLIVLGGMIAGNQPEPIVVYVGMLVVALVVIRQALVLRDNGVLLRQVVDAQERLTHLAYHDPLTGLANRIQFHDRLASAVVESRRCGRAVTVMIVDLDDFKMVNDSMGHGTGDAILRAVGDPDLPMLLATALRGGGGFDVHYQPVVRMDGATAPVAVEALARWTHPTLGAVPPDVFVAAAERAGLIAELDNLVLDRACHEAVTQDEPLDMHVNVCASRLCEPELEEAVRAALDRSGLPGTRLVLEITETSRVPDLDAAARTIVSLRQLGIRFAMDDFGTGYNTL